MVTVFGFIQVIIWHNGLFQIGGKKFLEYLERDVERNEEILNRDYLYKIIEYSVNRREFPDSMLITYQPPYKSEKLTKVSEETLQKWKKENGRLYFNCIESDFAIYTIPSEVEDYGFSKKEIGGIIMQNILNSGYDDNLEKYDQMIDYKYGSLRSRDSSVERIGKKYQKIFLYRCMGRLYDNYEYKSRYSYAEGNYTLIGEQGTSFREIDLTALPYEAEKDAFRAKQIYYPFSRYRDFSDEKWFHKKDVTQYFESLFLQKYNSDKYMILQGYFHDREKNSPKYREVWVQIRSYFFGKKYKQNFLDWLKGKDFEGRWMPEGTNHLYEVSIGEYPWSEYITQYLREMQEEQSFRGNSPAPCHIIPTVNDYNNEKDSEFCPSSIAGKFMFPCKDLFEVLDLKWDGKNGFCAKEKPAGPNGSGKSTFTSLLKPSMDYINADEIKKILKCSDFEAAKLAEKQREEHLKNMEDFCFETVLSTDRNLNLLKSAKEKGYFIRCYYILTADPMINIFRVRARVEVGGHDVPDDKIISRFDKALALVHEVVGVCDICHIYDNSENLGLLHSFDD